MKLSSLYFVENSKTLSLTGLALVLTATSAHAQPAPAVPEPPAAAPDAEEAAPAEPDPDAAAPGAEAGEPPAEPAPAEPPAETPAAAEPPPTSSTAAAAAPAEPEPMPEPVPPPPEELPAPEKPALKVGASLWSRYEIRENYAAHGLTHARLHREGDYVVSRARLSLVTPEVDAGDGVKVSGTFVPQAAYTWGETPGVATITDDPPIGLYEGYFSIYGDSARFDAGRFALNYGDALVIGNLGWNESARSFNGARSHFALGESGAYVDLFATLISEGRTSTGEALYGDRYFWGVYSGLGPLLTEGVELDAYFLGQTWGFDDGIVVTNPMDPTETTMGEREDATELTLGARLKGKADIFD